jgi:hypothetical protein
MSSSRWAKVERAVTPKLPPSGNGETNGSASALPHELMVLPKLCKPEGPPVRSRYAPQERGAGNGAFSLDRVFAVSRVRSPLEHEMEHTRAPVRVCPAPSTCARRSHPVGQSEEAAERRDLPWRLASFPESGSARRSSSSPTSWPNWAGWRIWILRLIE